MADGGGTNLGTAQGRVVITAETDAAAAQLTSFANKAEQLMKQVAGAFGVDLGIRGAVQLAQATVAATELATAYNRQEVAATSLAGSQAQLNDLLAVYDQATGGIVDKSTELANVTQLLSVGFADSTGELNQFATAIRGISVATGRSADTITQNLILELFSQRGQRLDQLGLQYDKVRQKADELQASDSNLTQQVAYQQAVLDQAIEKYGTLATSAEGAKTGLEHLGTAASNARLEIGQLVSLPVNTAANALSVWVEGQTKMMENYADAIARVIVLIRQIPGINAGQLLSGAATGLFGGTPPPAPPAGGQGGAGGKGGFGAPTPPVDPQLAQQQSAISDWWTKRQQIDTQFSQSISDEGARFSDQRLNAEKNYQEQVTESAASFAKQRMRAQEDYERSIVDIMRAAQARDARMAEDHQRDLERMQRDSAQRIGKLDEQLDRQVAQQRADSADRLAGFAIERDKTIEAKRQDSADNLLRIERDYDDQRTQAALAHQDTLSSAAARLDAFAVFEEQRRFAREQAQAAKSHDEKVDDEKTKLQKSIDQANEAYDTKVADEKKSLQKSIDQATEAHDRQVADEKAALNQRIADANDAYTRQLADAKAADDQRITDMAANFKLQKDREDADQTDRMTRMADHHTEEMNNFDTEHNKRVGQIIDHAKADRDQLDIEHQAQMKQLGDSNKEYDKLQADHDKEALRQQKLFNDEQNKLFYEQKIAELTAQLILAPFNGADIGALTTAIERLTTQYNAADTDITNLNNQAPTVTTSGVVSASGLVVSASSLPASAQVSTSGNNTSVTIAPGAITISGVSGQTATELAGIIDQRIYNAVLRATGRG